MPRFDESALCCIPEEINKPWLYLKNTLGDAEAAVLDRGNILRFVYSSQCPYTECEIYHSAGLLSL